MGLALTVLGAMTFTGRQARADVASWMFVGAGWSRIQNTGTELALDPSGGYSAVQVDAGFGTAPSAAWVIGGVFQATGHLGFGSDWGAAARVTTGGYSRGSWGLGLDVGPQYRFGDRSGPVGVARLLFGAPWGLGLSAGASYGAEETVAFTVALGIDFARLTVHRTTGLGWLPNPHPSPRQEDMAPPHQAGARQPSPAR